MKFLGMRLSDPRVNDVLLVNVSDEDYLYFVDDGTGVTYRLRIGVLRAAIGGGGGGGGIPAMDPVPAVGQLLAAGPDGTVVDAGATVAAFGAAIMMLSATLDTKVPLFAIMGDGEVTDSYAISASEAGHCRRIAPASNAVVISIDGDLWETGGPGRGFECSFRVTGIAHAITFLGTGSIVNVVYHGKNPDVTPLAVGDLIRVLVVSATEAHVDVTPALA